MSAQLDINERLRHLEATLTASTQHRARLLKVWSAAANLVRASRGGAIPSDVTRLLDRLAEEVDEADPARVVWPGVEDLTAQGPEQPSGNADQMSSGELFDEDEGEEEPEPELRTAQGPVPAPPGGVLPGVVLCSGAGCDAPIVFLRHERTHRMAPIDAYPREGGNVIVDPQAGTWRQATEEEKRALAGKLRWPHHATCPARQQFTRLAGRGIS